MVNLFSDLNFLVKHVLIMELEIVLVVILRYFEYYQELLVFVPHCFLRTINKFANIVIINGLFIIFLLSKKSLTCKGKELD